MVHGCKKIFTSKKCYAVGMWDRITYLIKSGKSIKDRCVIKLMFQNDCVHLTLFRMALQHISPVYIYTMHEIVKYVVSYKVFAFLYRLGCR